MKRRAGDVSRRESPDFCGIDMHSIRALTSIDIPRSPKDVYACFSSQSTMLDESLLDGRNSSAEEQAL